MKIEIDKSSDKCYSEVLAVMSDYEKLKDNPQRKVRGLATQAMILTGISVIFLLAFTILYMRDTSYTLYFYVVVVFAVAFILGIIYNILIYRRISRLKGRNEKRTLTIEDEYVELAVGDERTRLEMSEIQWVLINAHSVTFLPKNPSSMMIAVDKRYSNPIISAIPDKNLIIYNS